MTLPRTLAGLVIGVAACATTYPPPELLSARTAYATAARGPAASAAPDELHKARTALDVAEKAYTDHPRDLETRDLAYIAERKAQLADARARVVLAENSKASADQAYTKTLETKEKQAQRELADTKAQSAKTAEQLAAEQQALANEKQALASEKQARADADAKAAAALKDLAKIAQLREEDRGTVITLSGDVLFQ